MKPSDTPNLKPISEIDVLWITGGLSCDGDTIAMTAATQSSPEELVLVGIPGIPKVKSLNPFLSFENGEEFMQFFYGGAWIGVVETRQSIPNLDARLRLCFSSGLRNHYGGGQAYGPARVVFFH